MDNFTDTEKRILDFYCSNTNSDIFVLKNLPPSTGAALFARYSRSPKSLRRILLDEFLDDKVILKEENTTGAERTNKLFAKVLAEYGDDSVAQLATFQVAFEGVSQLLTKQIERGRLGAYLEQSTRYIPFDDKVNGNYKYYRPYEIMNSPYRSEYIKTMNKLFDFYSNLIPKVQAYLEVSTPGMEDPKARKMAIRALTLDILRFLLPVSTISNVGMTATPQSYENLIYRLRSSNLSESNETAEKLIKELNGTHPEFFGRVNREDRGYTWVEYLKNKNISKV